MSEKESIFRSPFSIQHHSYSLFRQPDTYEGHDWLVQSFTFLCMYSMFVCLLVCLSVCPHLSHALQYTTNTQVQNALQRFVCNKEDLLKLSCTLHETTCIGRVCIYKCYKEVAKSLSFIIIRFLGVALPKEVSEGCIAGPYKTRPSPHLRCSGLGVVEKKDAPNLLPLCTLRWQYH